MYIFYICDYCLFFIGCLGYRVYCEIGGEVCFDFEKNNFFNIFVIRKDSFFVCVLFDGLFIYVVLFFIDNCSIFLISMFMCLGNFMLDDVGIFLLYNGFVNLSVFLNSILLVKVSK